MNRRPYDGARSGDRIVFETENLRPEPWRTGTVTGAPRPASITITCDDGTRAIITRRGWTTRGARILIGDTTVSDDRTPAQQFADGIKQHAADNPPGGDNPSTNYNDPTVTASQLRAYIDNTATDDH